MGRALFLTGTIKKKIPIGIFLAFHPILLLKIVSRIFFWGQRGVLEFVLMYSYYTNKQISDMSASSIFLILFCLRFIQLIFLFVTTNML